MTYHVQFPGLGLEMTINRVALSIGNFNIYWYGVIIAAGMLLAILYAFHYADDFGINSDRLVDVILVGAVMAIVCARIYYVAFAPFEYESLWDMIDIRQGGIAIYGAVIGAFVFGGLMAKFRKVPILPLFDLVGICFLIGQGIGRWGNFVNQEAFGSNTTLPWGMYSEGTQAYLAGVQATLAAQGITVDPAMPVHPTFLYESIWCLVGFAMLTLYFKKRHFNGEIFLLYIIWYGLGRFWIEGLRTDALMLTANLRTSQLVALISVAAAVVLLVYGLQKSKGTTLMVPLAVADIKKQAQAGERFTVDSLPARASHKEFAAATAEMNRRLEELDLTQQDEQTVNPVEEQPAESSEESSEESGD
ncbi:MAG: prolipoprotein diacylglyceryl transferase [Oscillospiraceae bacterium]|nr:prolipoprotein diacylglyceryl transferase [Oscillospiraceae bacterium]